MCTKKHLRRKKITYSLICVFWDFYAFAWLRFCAFGAFGAYKIFS